MGSPVQTNQDSNAASSTTIGVAQTSNPTAGNVNIVWVRGPSGATVSGVADTLGNTYTARGNVTEAGTGQVLYQFTAPITTGGSANTVTATYGASTAYRGIVVLESAGSYDASNTGTDAGNNPTTSVSATNSAQPATVYMLCNDVQGGTPAVGTGFTDGGTVWATLGLIARVQYKTVATVGSQSGDFGNAGFDRNNTGLVILLDSAPPTISAQPTDQTANDGATATFSVTATGGTAPYTYQWQDNSSGSFANIGGATSSSYSPTASFAIQGRQYRCVVTGANSLSVTSSAAALRVAFKTSGTGLRSVPGLGAPFGAGSVEAWVQGQAGAGGGAAALQANVASVVTVTSDLSTQIRLAATASGQVTVTAALTTQIPLAAAPAAVTTVAAALTTQVRLAATPAAQVTVTAALTTGIPLAASAQSVVTVTAALASNAAALQSAVQGQATVTAALSTGIPLAAAPLSVCTVAAALTTGIPLAASAQGVTTVTAALAGTAAPLQASAQSQTTVAADLSTQIRLQAAVASVATVGAQLSTGIQLAAAASSSCTVTAALTTAIRLQASVQAVVTASATLAGTAAALQASVQSQSTVSAALTVAKPLACVVIAQAQVSAALTTRIALQAIAQAQTTATAALTTQQSYEAAVLCSVTVTAAFQVHPGARASSPGVQLARSGGQSLRRPTVVALKRK